MFRAFLFTFLIITSLELQANEEPKCNAAGNQLELNACALDEFSKADKDLNETYQSLINRQGYNLVFISKLRLAQKAWVIFRDADVAARFACSEGDVHTCWGSIYTMSVLYRKAELTRERTKHLGEIIKDGLGK